MVAEIGGGHGDASMVGRAGAGRRRLLAWRGEEAGDRGDADGEESPMNLLSNIPEMPVLEFLSHGFRCAARRSLGRFAAGYIYMDNIKLFLCS